MTAASSSLLAALVVTCFCGRLDSLSAACDSCVPESQCLVRPPPGSAQITCTLASGEVGLCCRDSEHTAGRSAGACRAPVLCPPVDLDTVPTCPLSDGSSGVLCPPAPNASWSRRLVGRRAPLLAPQGVPDGTEAQRQAELHMKAFIELEDRLEAVLHRPGDEEADLIGLKTAAGGDPDVTQEVGKIGLQRLLTMRAIFNHTTLAEQQDVGDTSLHPSLLVPGCVPAEQDSCDFDGVKNRALSGECNHVEHAFLGRSLTGLGRLSSATFEDNLFFEPRGLAVDGSLLPSPASAGSVVVQQSTTAILSRWAVALSEYIGIDMARTSPFRLWGRREPDCCTEQHPACLPLRVADRCINFVRVLPAPQLDCVMRPATPLSAASSYLDLDMLYGTSEEAGRRLRTFHGGRLRNDRGLDSDQTLLEDDLSVGTSQVAHVRRRRSELARRVSPQGQDTHTYILRAPDDPETSFTFGSVRDDNEPVNIGDDRNRQSVIVTADFDSGNRDETNLGSLEAATRKRGRKGEKGDQGLPGEQGEKGMPGRDGRTGSTGSQGRKGMKGKMGEKGERGERGENGLTGLPGSPGSKGDEGKPGKAGEPGNPGRKGKQGEPGEVGEPGNPGQKGEPGKEGTQGPIGRPGNDGVPGRRGEKGMPGEKGERGKRGDEGKSGERGPRGERGDRGQQGVRGEKGERGSMGLRGEIGPQGPPGVTKVVYVDKPREYGLSQPSDVPHAPYPTPSTQYGAPRGSWSTPHGTYQGSSSLFRPHRLPRPDRIILRASVEASSERIHQLLLSEHNRVADAVRRNHPHWEDERVFQLSRRIAVAEWQHIIYREYLPHVLGADTARGLLSTKNTNPDVDPTVNVEFAAAAFRFWQRPRSTKRDKVPRKTSKRSFLDIVRGTVGSTGAERPLPDIGRDATDSAPFELAAVDVLRGRELGLPTYVAIHELCMGSNVTSWTDLKGVVPQPELDKLRLTYSSPQDVDLWVGGMVEGLAPAAKVGPTFQCVIEDQFRRLRDGDHHFYDRILSGAQLDEVQKASLARLLCDNQPGGRDGVLPLVLEPISAQNKMTLCSSAAIPRVNLDVF